MNNLKRTGEALLPAIAYGDAAGLPVETRSHKYIRDTYGTIDRLIPVRENPFYVGDFDTGTWSDDTQLSMAVTRALVTAGGFEMQSIADEHAAEYHLTPQITKPNGQTVKRGWGGSTTASMERFLAGVPIEQCGEVDGSGNGVIMKMAPLAYWLINHETDERETYRMLDEFTSFTHDSAISRVATRVHYDVLRRLQRPGRVLKRLGSFAYHRALLHEAFQQDTSHHVSEALQYLKEQQSIDSDVILEHTDGKGFYVPQTLAMAYGAFLANNGRFSESIYEAVNLGGDTDSTASIAAAMSVMKWSGMTDRPQDMNSIAQLDVIASLSRQLAEDVI